MSWIDKTSPLASQKVPKFVVYGEESKRKRNGRSSVLHSQVRSNVSLKEIHGGLLCGSKQNQKETKLRHFFFNQIKYVPEIDII